MLPEGSSGLCRFRRGCAGCLAGTSRLALLGGLFRTRLHGLDAIALCCCFMSRSIDLAAVGHGASIRRHYSGSRDWKRYGGDSATNPDRQRRAKRDPSSYSSAMVLCKCITIARFSAISLSVGGCQRLTAVGSCTLSRRTQHSTATRPIALWSQRCSSRRLWRFDAGGGLHVWRE